MNKQEQIAILKAHRQSLSNSIDFESFKTVQLAYVDFLIIEIELEAAKDNPIYNWITKVNIDV